MGGSCEWSQQLPDGHCPCWCRPLSHPNLQSTLRCFCSWRIEELWLGQYLWQHLFCDQPATTCLSASSSTCSSSNSQIDDSHLHRETWVWPKIQCNGGCHCLQCQFYCRAHLPPPWSESSTPLLSSCHYDNLIRYSIVISWFQDPVQWWAHQGTRSMGWPPDWWQCWVFSSFQAARTWCECSFSLWDAPPPMLCWLLLTPLRARVPSNVHRTRGAPQLSTLPRECQTEGILQSRVTQVRANSWYRILPSKHCHL